MDCTRDVVSISCKLYTGKMHQVVSCHQHNRQIRVHMKDALGIELLNDVKFFIVVQSDSSIMGSGRK